MKTIRISPVVEDLSVAKDDKDLNGDELTEEELKLLQKLSGHESCSIFFLLRNK